MIEMGKADAMASLDGLLFYVGFLFFSLDFSSSETVLLLISFHKTCKQGRVGNVAKACAPCQARKTDGTPRPGGKAWLGVYWSWTEVVWMILRHLEKTSSSGVPFLLRTSLSSCHRSR